MPPAAWRTVKDLSITGHYQCSVVGSADTVQSHILYELWAKSKCFSHEWVILPGQGCFHGKEVWRSTDLAFYIASGLWKNKGPSGKILLIYFSHLNEKQEHIFKEKNIYGHQSVMCGYRRAMCYR